MNDYIYNPVGYKYLEKEEGKEELQKEINKIKSISNEKFSLTEDDYIGLAYLSIISKANLRELSYQMLTEKLQITEMLIVVAKELIGNKSELTIAGKFYKTTIDSQQLILHIYSRLLSFFKRKCGYEICLIVHTKYYYGDSYLPKRQAFINLFPAGKTSLPPKPTKPAIEILERIKEIIAEEQKDCTPQKASLAILVPAIYRIIAKKRTTDSPTKLAAFIYDIIVQMGRIEQVERNDKQKYDYLKRYFNTARKDIADKEQNT